MYIKKAVSHIFCGLDPNDTGCVCRCVSRCVSVCGCVSVWVGVWVCGYVQVWVWGGVCSYGCVWVCADMYGRVWVCGDMGSLVPRPSTPPVFDRLQYAKTEGEGLGNFIT